MSEQYKFRDPAGLYFTTTTVVDWIDVFTKPVYKELILKALKYNQQNKGLRIHAWVLMTNHLHMIISAKESYNLSAIMRDFKKFTSKQIIKLIQSNTESRKDWMLKRFEYAGKYSKRITNYKFWQDGNHPIELDSNKMIDQKLDYIHNNPVVQQIVETPEEYVYSSAKDYAGIKGLLDIERID